MQAEMITFHQVQNILSDAYKDAYGFRPSVDYINDCESMSDVDFNDEWNRLCDAIENSISEEKAQQEKAILEFEGTITNLINSGAGDRETAIRWFIDAEDDYVKVDRGYFEYLHGLPTGYTQN